MEDNKDYSYLEKLSGAIVVVPNSVQRKVNYFKEIGDGRLAIYNPERKFLANDFRGETSKINNLIDQKVVFIPLQTKDDRTAYESFRVKTKQIPLEFEVSKVNSQGIEKIVRKIRAEVYNPFTEKEARRVSHFVRRYVYPNSVIKYK
jgi:hypothetical protein